MSTVTGWADVAGGRLPYEVAGDGPGVVLAHAGIADMRQWDPQWEALAAAPPRRPLRPPRVRPRRRRRHPVLEPRRPRRGHGRRGPRPGGARRLLAGGLDRHRHRARVPGPRVAASPGSAAGSAGSRPRRRRSRPPRSSERRPSRPRRTGRPPPTTTSRSGSTASGSPRAGRLLRRATRSARWPSRPTSRRSRTATRSCSTRRPSGGSAELRVPVLAMTGGLDESATRVGAAAIVAGGPAAPGASTSPTSPTCRASSARSGSPRRCSSSSRPSRASARARSPSRPHQTARRPRSGSAAVRRGRASRTAGTSRGARRPRRRDRAPVGSTIPARPSRRTQPSRLQSSSQRSTSNVIRGRRTMSRIRARCERVGRVLGLLVDGDVARDPPARTKHTGTRRGRPSSAIVARVARRAASTKVRASPVSRSATFAIDGVSPGPGGRVKPSPPGRPQFE